MGTSLTVHPFASLVSMVPEFCPRVLVNLDQVGNFGSRPDDVMLLGKSDDVVRELAKELGWEEELDRLWKDTEGSVVYMLAPPEKETVVEKAEAEADKEPAESSVTESTKDEIKLAAEIDTLKEEVDKLTAEVEKALNISQSPASSEQPKQEDTKKTGAEEENTRPQSVRKEDTPETTGKL